MTLSLTNGVAIALVSSSICLLTHGGAHADVHLAKVLADHMVLQEGQPLPFWGTAAPGEKVTVTLQGKSATSKATTAGHWKVTIPALMGDGKPFDVTVTGHNKIVLTDVLLGEVWVASGQSNMEMPVKSVANGDEEVKNANYPNIRLFRVVHDQRVKIDPTDVQGTWSDTTPQSVADFSAAGYFFGRRLHQTTDKPIGIIDTSWGGTRAEAWTRVETVRKNPRLAILVKNVPKKMPSESRLDEMMAAYQETLEAWDKTQRNADPENTGFKMGWADPKTDTKEWDAVDMPAHWETFGYDLDGVAWFRKSVTVPAHWVGKDLSLSLGVLNDCDVAYINGKEIGHTCHDTGFTRGSRNYTVPGNLVTSSTVVIAIRIFDERGDGGFSGHPDHLTLVLAGNPKAKPISLAGPWAMRFSHRLAPAITDESKRPDPPAGYKNQHTPGVLWSSMVAPLVPFAIKGVIWYQGESNTHRAFQYRELFATLIKDWRQAWGQGAFPFYFVQLANYHAGQSAAGRDYPLEWAELREAQTMALRLPKTGMAVTIDIGNPADIHPLNKQQVGERLARWALAKDYGKDVVVSGPLYKRAVRSQDKMIVSFEHDKGLKTASGGAPYGFEIADSRRIFVRANARIKGDAVVVWAPGIDKPVAVRYGWSDAPTVNLQNAEGLPASPFRSDNWPMFTGNSKRAF